MNEPAPSRPSPLPVLLALVAWLVAGALLVLAALVVAGACPHAGDPHVVVARILLLGAPILALAPASLTGLFVHRGLRRRAERGPAAR